MNAKQLQDLAERLMLGEYTTQDLHDAARCAKAWAKVERTKERTGNHTWCIVSDRHGFTLDTAWAGEHDPHLSAIDAVEAATEAKP